MNGKITNKFQVMWLEQQVVKKRVKRDFIPTAHRAKHASLPNAAPIGPIRPYYSPHGHYHQSSLATNSAEFNEKDGEGGSGRNPTQMMRGGYHRPPRPELAHQMHSGEGSVIQHSDYENDDYFEADDFLNMNRVQDRQYYGRLRFTAPNDPYWKDMFVIYII